jgi:tripartite-type tricarboxylate transporter receptor subunit TctC
MVVTDVAAGHLKLASISLATALGQIRANRVVPLAVSAQQRVAELPNVPTFKELGYPEIEVTSWFSISAPAGLPDEIVQRLNREVVRALQHPETQKRLEQEAIELKPLDPRMFNEFVKSEIARWAPIAAKTLTKR